MYETFISYYGVPAANTGEDLGTLGLPPHPDLQTFIQEVGGGIFAEGMLSICSKREAVKNLGGWEVWLPDNARLVGTGVLGFMFVLVEDHFWIVDTQNGQVVEVGMSCAEFINRLAEATIREDFLKESYFLRWNQQKGPLKTNQVLNPVPALPLGGDLDNLFFSPVSLDVYLSFTAQLFEASGGMPAEVWPLGSN